MRARSLARRESSISCDVTNLGFGFGAHKVVVGYFIAIEDHSSIKSLGSLTQFDRQPLCAVRTSQTTMVMVMMICYAAIEASAKSSRGMHVINDIIYRLNSLRIYRDVCICLGAVFVVVVDDLGCLIFAVEFSIWFFFFCIATIHILSVSNNIIYDGMVLYTHTFYIECFISVLFSFVDDVSSLFVMCLLFFFSVVLFSSSPSSSSS